MPSVTQCALIAVALAFIAAGMLFVPRLGIEVDEAIVANGIYDHGDPWYSWKFADHEVPVMLISYLGAVKTWFYNGVFLFTPPRPIVLRLPMLLLAAGTLWLFFELLDRTMSRQRGLDRDAAAGDRYQLPVDEHRRLWSRDSAIRVQAGGAGVAGAVSPERL